MNRLRPQRSQRPPSSFSPLSGKSLLGRILCSLAACSLFSLFCRVLSANIIGVDELGPYFQPAPFYASLPLLLIFYFILRKSLFLFSVPRELPPLSPYDGSDGVNRKAGAAAFFHVSCAHGIRRWISLSLPCSFSSFPRTGFSPRRSCSGIIIFPFFPPPFSSRSCS